MSKIYLRHTLIKKYPWHFSWFLYLYTFSLYKRNLLFVWPIYTISALVIRMLMCISKEENSYQTCIMIIYLSNILKPTDSLVLNKSIVCIHRFSIKHIALQISLLIRHFCCFQHSNQFAYTALFIISYLIFIIRIRFRSVIGICKLLFLCFKFWFLLITFILTIVCLKKNSLKIRTKLKRANITKFKNKEIKIKLHQINDKNNKKH
jgi:hypothetical protein